MNGSNFPALLQRFFTERLITQQGASPHTIAGYRDTFRLLLQFQRILAIPAKRFERGPVEFLTEEEASALVSAPNAQTWIGRRDRALLLVAVQTGMRNSEITLLRCQ